MDIAKQELQLHYDSKEAKASKKRSLQSLMASISSDGSTKTSASGANDKQPRIDSVLRDISKADVDRAFGKAIYSGGHSANSVCNNPYWAEVFRLQALYGPGWKMPGADKVLGDLLDEVTEDVDKEVQGDVLANKERYGGTVVSDGWTNVRNAPLLNALFVTHKGAVLIEAENTAGEVKDYEYIGEFVCTAIEAVGPENVTQVVFDNASAGIKAAEEVVCTR